MSLRLWEDGLNPVDCMDVRAAVEAELAAQMAMVEQLRRGPEHEELPLPDMGEPGAWTHRRVLRLRHALGMTQRELAAEVKVHRRTIQWWEHGLCKPGTFYVDRLIELEERAKADE